MTADERQTLIEAVTTAFRPRDALRNTLRAHDAWYDLDETGRLEAYEETLRAREYEAALDPHGLTTTARAVLRRVR